MSVIGSAALSLHDGLREAARARRDKVSILAMRDLTPIHRTRIAALCRRYRVRRLELFGSAVRADFEPTRSDVDFLVQFDDGERAPGLEAYFGLKQGLEALLGRPVDLIMPEAVTNPYVRADIARDRTTVYAA